MTDDSSEFIEQKKSELDADDPRIQLEALCKERGFECSWYWHEPRLLFRVDFPNGKTKRRQVVSKGLANQYLSIELPSFTYLGDLDAVLFRDTQTIEAAASLTSPASRRIHDLPGIRRIGHPQGELFDLEEDGEPEQRQPNSGLTINDAWVLDFTPTPDRPDLRVSMGSASRRFNVISDRNRRRALGRDREPLPYGLGRFTTIRISGVTATRHDDALQILNRVSGATFFELDLQYGVAPMLVPSWGSDRARTRIRPELETIETTPRNPQNQYPDKPLSLYWYGRSSSGIPLLEYLAYYQVLEYFFPSFSHRETLEKLRNELLDPRFRPDDDSNLVRIINLASGTGKGFGSEREQLRSTIGGCVTDGHVRDFIESSEVLADHFSGKQKIKDVTLVNLEDTKNDLLTAVANRVYDIRCRIVHAKEDGGKSSVDLLLPFSKEAEALGPDIELIKFLAQKVLIAGATRLGL
ncbi:hypothetical protein ACFW2K_09700 [Streptomyces nigra]|uniref:hypothetical protein n=1 Tax=Streptomyces nigra TaxID=1827580 RepID=UPI0036B1E67B